MEKTVTISGKEYRMKATARTPRLYRYYFGRDIIQDMASLQKQATNVMNKKAAPSMRMLSLLEDLSWLFIKQAEGDAIPNNPDDWLDGIDGTFSVWEAMPAIFEVWAANTAQTSEVKKK